MNGRVVAKPAETDAVQDEDFPLLDRILAGDVSSFKELVRRYKQRVFRIAMAITDNNEDAEEAAQQTFFKVYRNLSGFRRTSKFTTWLTRIAMNEALQKRRRRRNTESLDDLMSSEQNFVPRQLRDWHESPESIYSREEMRTIVQSAVQSLPTKYRQAFVMRDIEGLTTEEAAEALQLSIPSLKTRLLRARLMLREELSKQFQLPATLKSRMLLARWKVADALMEHFRVSSEPEREDLPMLNCRYVLDELSDFLDGEVSPELKRALEGHLAKCRRCSVVYSTTRKMLTIVNDTGVFEIPADFDARLRSKLSELFPGR